MAIGNYVVCKNFARNVGILQTTELRFLLGLLIDIAKSIPESFLCLVKWLANVWYA